MTDQTKLLTMAEAARRIGIDVRTLRAWTEKGIVAYVELPNGRRRFVESEIERMIDEMYKKGKAVA